MSRRITLGDLAPAVLSQARARYAEQGGRGAADYVRRAQAHRPTDPEAIAAEVRRLAASGLRPADVATALRMNPAAVLEALAAPVSPPSGGRSRRATSRAGQWLRPGGGDPSPLSSNRGSTPQE
jgi:hypothetical protein